MIDRYQGLLLQIELLKNEGDESREIIPETIKKELDLLLEEAIDFANILRNLTENKQKITISKIAW
jgi:hypothetical protein